MDQTSVKDHPWPSSGKAWYAVGILVVAFIFSFIDRIIIALLVEPIKLDLGVSDFGIGMLQGLAFAVFYALVGIPIGRWADRYSRRWIIGAGILLWSVMTAACGLARNFWHLFLARVGVGVGEAALSPAAYSMIADYFPKEKLGRALGVYQAGAFIGAGMAFLVGGLVIQFVVGSDDLVLPLIGTIRSWQMVFFVVGLPGVLVALLMFTVTEPPRRGKLAGHADGIPLGMVLRYVREHWRLYTAHFCGFALLAVPITTILTWAPAYFNRVLGYTRPEAGLTLGLILIVLSPAGVYFGGWLVDTLQKRGYADATFRVGMGASVLLLPLSFLSTTGSDSTVAVALFCPFIFCASISMAVAPAALQVVTPNQMRAQVSATWMLVLNLATAGIGPTAVGFMTAFVFADDLAVGSSIALVNCVSVPVAGLVLWSGLKSFRIAATGQPTRG
jgi:MFS family permease